MTTEPSIATTAISPQAGSRSWRVHTTIALGGLGVLASQTATPTPLYPVYAERWSLEPLAVSAVFAAYVLGLTVALLFFGALSDHVGRRPVGVVALTCAASAMTVLALAGGLEMLVVGRVLQGLAAGLGMAAFGAALIDHSPPERRPFYAMVNSALLPVATGLGAVVSALVLEAGGGSLRAPFVVQGVGIVAALVAALLLQERHPRRPGALRSLRPGVVVPVGTRRLFALAAAALCAAWSLVGLYLGIGPTVSATIFGVDTPVAGSLAVLSASGTGGVASLLTVRLAPRRAITVGSWLLLVAAALIAVAVLREDLVLYYVASTIGGFGFGSAFQGGLRIVVAVAPAADRAGVMAALYLVSYLAFGLPTLGAGLLIPTIGLAAAVVGYGVLVATLTVTSLVLGAATRR